MKAMILVTEAYLKFI